MYQCCYISAVTNRDDDPTLISAITPMRDLLLGMDSEIARLYRERGISGVRPRYSMALIRLHRRGPMTVRELAAQVDVTHSAMSQTVSVMRREGLVDSAPGSDARTREIRLTARGREIVPFLEAEWRATEAALADLEAELPYPMARWVADMNQALARRSFLDRITDRLREPE